MAREKICCIYRITSKVHPDRIYIGSTIDWVKRKSLHKRGLEKKNHPNVILQHHVDKYGMEDINFEIIELIERPIKEIILDREQYYIDTLTPYFNILPNAGSCLGMVFGVPSAEKRKKLSCASMGNKSALGSIRSEETRRKISIGNMGKPKSEAHKKALSKAWERRKLYPIKEETRIKCRDANIGRKPWNTGLTKETDERLLKKSEKQREQNLIKRQQKQ